MEINIQGLTKKYEEKTVLDIEALQIKTGSLCGIIGANGAGKSTFFNLVAGLINPTEGKILYGENNLEQKPYKDMTMVFQAPYLMRTTVEKNIAYPLEIRGWDKEKIEARVLELTTELGLLDFRKQKAWKLSGGEIQKVALARALSFHPKLLLLDEPTANVDPATTAEIERMLRKINEEEKTTVLIITHNLVQAKRLCKEVIFLNKGKLVEHGDCEKVLKNPDEELTKRFIEGELLI